ncbi:MAG: hypothetical protein ACU833_10555 [Gammaproteobacteria bacterium]
MKKFLLNFIGLFVLSVLISACATKASSSFSNAGNGYLNPAKQVNLTPPEGPFEVPQTFKVSDILPPEMIVGPNHSVDPFVLNDGYLYIYTIKSKDEPIRAVSTAMAYKRIHEINAIAEIEKHSKLGEFAGGVGEKGKDVVKGAVDLVAHPIDTVSGAVSGVGKLFGRAGENLFGQARSDAEDNRLKSLAGFSKTKRDYGYDLNVDVYSRNPHLQDALDDLTWSGYTGNLAMSVVVSAFTGPITTATGSTNLMNKVFRDTAPADLRIMNREKLKKMRVTDSVVDSFIQNGIFTPREQTIIVDSLDDMKSTLNREAFIQFATNTDDPDVAFFRQRQAEMYADYNRKIGPIYEFKNLRPFTAGVAAGKKVVFCFPLDHLLWTEDIAKVVTFLNASVSSLNSIKTKMLVFQGTVSSLAKKNLTDMGWEIKENIF